MYKILKEGTLVGIASAPTYIKKLDNGCYGLCSPEEAQGIAFDGKPLQLDGKTEMGGLDVVAVDEEADSVISKDHTAAAKVFVEQAESGNIDDNTALQHKGLFDEWKAGEAYAVDAIRRYNTHIYKCNLAHTSQADWYPSIVPNLWTEIAEPGEYREIKDGMLSTEAFALGEIGWYQEKSNLYKSLMENNVYTPVAYPAGWEKLE